MGDKSGPSTPPSAVAEEPAAESNPYDRAEAQRIFLRYHEHHEPNAHAPRRRQMLSALFKAVVEAAKASGYEVARERNGYVVSHPGCGAVYLSARENGAEPFVVAIEGGYPSRLPVEYDAGVGYFVPQRSPAEEDPQAPCRPGQPKDAVAAVAQLICQIIDKQYEDRTRPR